RLDDRDGNKVNDFWTGDIASLYFLQVKGAPLALVDRTVAEADSKPLHPRETPPTPYHGYYFMVLEGDDSIQPSEDYRQITDKASGPVHHRTKFGVCAYPAHPNVSGSYLYLLNENYTVLRSTHRVQSPPKSMPKEEVLRKHWSKFGN